jgi:glycosyltransferase involved in cell wall biosynthesis
VRKIHNGIDSAAFARRPGVRERMRESIGIPLDAPVLGAIGRLESEKRFDLLLEIAAALDTRAFVVIAGDGSLRPALERQAAALGISDRVKLLGLRRDPADVHHAFDVYVQTSEREGIPNALLEAMAVGTAIVATDVGGTRELITDGVHGRLAPRADLAALTAAVRDTLNDPKGAAARVQAARTRVENEFSFSSRLAIIEQIYRELARSRPCAA